MISDGITNRPGCSGADACQSAMNTATSNANTAKQAGTQIYTIHFGENASVPGGITSQDFLASLANNSAVDHFLTTSIWNDNFGNTNNAIVVGWTETGNSSSNNTSIAGVSSPSDSDDLTRDGVPSNKFARIGNNEWICRQVVATGLTSLKIQYYWRGDSDAEDNEYGRVEYRTGGSCTNSTGWTQIASHELDNDNINSSSWSSLQTISLPTSLNNSSFLVRFRNTANANTEHFRVDDVNITATAVDVATENDDER